MKTVTSADGTSIACHPSGAGPALVLVHGTAAANPRAWPAFAGLEKHFTVYAMDRRGRGESGDAASYAMEGEFEDIAAVLDAIPEPANLLGHSLGGLFALEAALLTGNVRRMILYEPLLPARGQPFYPAGFVERLEELLDAGDREGVLTMFYSTVAGMAREDIEQLKASPAWPDRLASAHTVPREMLAVEQYRFDAQRLRDLHTPTLLLHGGDSPDFARAAIEALAPALPDSRIVAMAGLQHVAMYNAPELFVHEVLKFLSE